MQLLRLLGDYLNKTKPIILNEDANLKETETQYNAVYLKYDELNCFDVDENMDIVAMLSVDKIINTSCDWTETFEGVNLLRRILKYSPDCLIVYISKLIPAVMKHCKSIRSNLSKISLIFVTELLGQPNLCFQEFMNDLIHLLFIINGQKEKRFLSEEAEKALEAAIMIHDNIELLCIILSGLKDKNLNASGSAFKTLESFLNINSSKVLSKVVFNNDHTIIYRLLVLCCEIFELRKEPYLKRSLFFYNLMLKQFGKEMILSTIESSQDSRIRGTLAKIEKALMYEK